MTARFVMVFLGALPQNRRIDRLPGTAPTGGPK
ncbi:hypothetical protein FHS22_002643 [Planomonospora venezuelensis]|uniref:Uncharacterized protein n=1 Tax=Planomonospora venezuelensis TaxID=1999 RepID=A0A841D4D7_PLAVE|nr:hypothetical protein [Planomonospora venezuelensis]